MILHRHVLKGCTPTPLAHYLKALGILRLVAEQADTGCRGFWKDDRFELATCLTQEGLESFFMDLYEPTPIIDPWNGGSGFYEKDNKDALEALMGANETRLGKMKKAIVWALGRTEGWPEAPSEGAKLDFQRECFNEWRDTSAIALACAIVLEAEQNGISGQKARYPALLGTGWNDGRLDFACNFHQRLCDVLGLGEVKAGAQANKAWLKNALWADADKDHKKAAIGQFFPESVGGANSTTGPDGNSSINPWDYILMMEGAVLFTASATKRLNPSALVQASAPFALRGHTAGSGTGSNLEKSDRGEQWMPIWSAPLGIGELKSLLAEGRAQVGKEQAARPVDMARAIASLGVAKGITSFQRFGYLERNGQARLAVPLSRVSVTERPRARLVDDLAGWLARVQRLCHDKGAPGRVALVERVLFDAVFDALTHDDTPVRWQTVLRAAVAVEQLQAVGTAIKAGPIPRLSPEWVTACDDGSPEFRLALALGSASAGRRLDPLRHHWLPLKPGAQGFNKNDDRLVHDVRVVAHGRDGIEDLLAVVERRSFEGEKQSRHPAIIGAWGAEADLPDLAAWVAGEVDVGHCINLARAFMALDWQRWDAKSHGFKRAAAGGSRLPEAWMMLRLCALPWAVSDREIAFDPGILRRLEAGDLDGALRIAARRLQAHGIRPMVKSVLGGEGLARLWGSALAFPVSEATALTLVETLQPQNKELSHAH